MHKKKIVGGINSAEKENKEREKQMFIEINRYKYVYVSPGQLSVGNFGQ